MTAGAASAPSSAGRSGSTRGGKKVLLRKLSSALGRGGARSPVALPPSTRRSISKGATREEEDGVGTSRPTKSTGASSSLSSLAGGCPDTPPVSAPSASSAASSSSSSASESSSFPSGADPPAHDSSGVSAPNGEPDDGEGKGEKEGGRSVIRTVVAAYSQLEQEEGMACEEVVEAVAVGDDESDEAEVRATALSEAPPPSDQPFCDGGSNRPRDAVGLSRSVSSSSLPPGAVVAPSSLHLIKSSSSSLVSPGPSCGSPFSRDFDYCDEDISSDPASSASAASSYDLCGDNGAASFSALAPASGTGPGDPATSPNGTTPLSAKRSGRGNGGAWRYLTKRTRPLRRPLRHALRATWSHFDPGDFQAETWSDALNDVTNRAMENPVQAAGLALAGAVVVTHPLMVLAGAVWAVGLLKGAEQGYEFFSDGAFRGLFWEDPAEDRGDVALAVDSAAARALFSSSSSSIEYPGVEEDGSIEVSGLATFHVLETDVTLAEKELRAEAETDPASMLAPKPESDLLSSPIQNATQPLNDDVMESPVSIDLPAISAGEILDLHFPPLACTAASDVPFPGLDAAEFFAVFFSDDAPYSLKEFHESRGDINVCFRAWEERTASAAAATEKESWCFDTGRGGSAPPPPPSTIARLERVLTFKTLTKSYFGPAYASATKTQRVSLASRDLLVVENRTRLADVPYGDRFEVLDRWTVVASPESEGEGEGGCGCGPRDLTKVAPYTSRLTVTCQVNMIKPCTWESQIRKKTLSTVTEMAESWCELATTALKAAEKRKKERLKEKRMTPKKERTDVEEKGYRSETEVCHQPPLESASPLKNQEKGEQQVGHQLTSEPAALPESKGKEQQSPEDPSRLLSLHRRRIKELERRIAAGDLEGCSVEVKRKDGRRESLGEFCEVLGAGLHTKGGGTDTDWDPVTAASNGESADINLKEEAESGGEEVKVDSVKRTEESRKSRKSRKSDKGRKSVIKLLSKKR